MQSVRRKSKCPFDGSWIRIKRARISGYPRRGYVSRWFQKFRKAAGSRQGGNNFIIPAHGLIQRRNSRNEGPPMVPAYTRKPESGRRGRRREREKGRRVKKVLAGPLIGQFSKSLANLEISPEVPRRVFLGGGSTGGRAVGEGMKRSLRRVCGKVGGRSWMTGARLVR